MNDKEKIKQLEKENKELKNANEYYKSECESYWADLQKRQKFNLAIAQKIVKTDSKAIANIILNMYFGKMPSDSCRFCEIFDLKGKGYCKEDLRCTDCIDSFLKQHYENDASKDYPITPETARIISLSTAHLLKEDAYMLEAESNEPCDTPLNGLTVYKKSQYGYFVYIAKNRRKSCEKYWPESIRNAVCLAEKIGAHIICFDRDIDPLPQTILRSYDW